MWLQLLVVFPLRGLNSLGAPARRVWWAERRLKLWQAGGCFDQIARLQLLH